jgi:trehalose-phosphatase
MKSAAIAWHYRGAQREFGARQAHELRMLLGDALSNQPLEVLEGKKVIEVRFRGISKAVVAHEDPTERARRITVAFGDDRTDEDLFRALPDTSITVAGELFTGRCLTGCDSCPRWLRESGRKPPTATCTRDVGTRPQDDTSPTGAS